MQDISGYFEEYFTTADVFRLDVDKVQLSRLGTYEENSRGVFDFETPQSNAGPVSQSAYVKHSSVRCMLISADATRARNGPLYVQDRQTQVITKADADPLQITDILVIGGIQYRVIDIPPRMNPGINWVYIVQQELSDTLNRSAV